MCFRLPMKPALLSRRVLRYTRRATTHAPMHHLPDLWLFVSLLSAITYKAIYYGRGLHCEAAACYDSPVGPPPMHHLPDLWLIAHKTKKMYVLQPYLWLNVVETGIWSKSAPHNPFCHSALRALFRSRLPTDASRSGEIRWNHSHHAASLGRFHGRCFRGFGVSPTRQSAWFVPHKTKECKMWAKNTVLV